MRRCSRLNSMRNHLFPPPPGVHVFNQSFSFVPPKLVLKKTKNYNISYYIMNTFIKLDYPYYKYEYIFDKNSKKIFLKDVKNLKQEILTEIPNNLNKTKYKLEKYDGHYFIIKSNFLKENSINSITDIFSEHIRIRCRFANHLSPLDYWTNNKKKILTDILKKNNEITIFNIREYIYKNYKLCSNFRITIALSILQHFKPTKWLDISSGWGDRLMAAILFKIKLYEGTDPNLDLHPCYNNMIESFVPPSKRKNFIIHKNGFYEAEFTNKDFDIVFTSPPFYKTEIYSSYNENSVTKYNSEEEWIKEFLIKCFTKAFTLIKKGGHMILYMGGSKNVMDAMSKLLNGLMTYKGVIYFYEKSPRGMYVWQKK